MFISRSQLILLNAIDANQLRLEHERRTARNRTNTAVAVAILGGNSQGALLANAHIKKTLVPSAKH